MMYTIPLIIVFAIAAAILIWVNQRGRKSYRPKANISPRYVSRFQQELEAEDCLVQVLYTEGWNWPIR